jgi:ankyrin repeat protein
MTSYAGSRLRMVETLFAALVFIAVASSQPMTAQEKEKKADLPSFDYQVTEKHEIKPHRRSIPHEGIGHGFNQLHLELTVSAQGDVVDAKANGDEKLMAIWPDLQGEVRAWKFTPFEKDGKPVSAKAEEYLDLVPPERLPAKHVQPPQIRSNSKVAMTLSRSGCYGTCPSYKVTVSTTGVNFDGGGYVVASGKHTAAANANAVRELARKFAEADFYSMDAEYFASVTDNPSYHLSISIDGHKKEIEDYVGAWVGMPAIVTELEEAVDDLAGTNRWVNGADGLVEALQAEKFNFKSYEAQVILKAAAQHGQTETVQDLLDAGIPLAPLPAPKSKDPEAFLPSDDSGWLTAASRQPEVLQVFIDAEASKKDQADKDLALNYAAETGNLKSVRQLIDYGANPNVDLRKVKMKEEFGNMTMEGPGAGSILIAAAHSGNPELLREILSFHPDLEAKDREGKTALFLAGDYTSDEVEDSARAECVRLLVEAGANVNARDSEANTPLHETFLTPVEEELLKLGADVNARNNDGETPIFTTYDDDAIPLYLKHGADLTIRNSKGETVLEAAKNKGPQRLEVLKKAVAESSKQ